MAFAQCPQAEQVEQAEFQALDEARAIRAAITAQTPILTQIATLLHELRDQPRLHATIIATGGTSGTAAVNHLLNDYTALPPSTEPALHTLYTRYQDYVRGEYEWLDFRGILQVQNVLKLPLDAIYVPLDGVSPIHDHGRQRLLVPHDDAAFAPNQIATARVPLHQLVGDHHKSGAEHPPDHLRASGIIPA